MTSEVKASPRVRCYAMGAGSWKAYVDEATGKGLLRRAETARAGVVTSPDSAYANIKKTRPGVLRRSRVPFRRDTPWPTRPQGGSWGRLPDSGGGIWPQEKGRLDLPTLENWLWEAACAIRGPVDAPKFKDYILPLIFLKCLSDVFDDEIERLANEYGSQEMAMHLIEGERVRGTIAQGKGIVRVYIPPRARWNASLKARARSTSCSPP